MSDNNKSIQKSPLHVELKSFGCTANFGEGEVIRGLLTQAGVQVDPSQQDPDLLLFNVCTVKGDASAYKEVKKALEAHPKRKLLLTGCVTPQLVSKIRKLQPESSFLTTHQISQVANAVSKTMQGDYFEDLRKSEPGPKINLPRINDIPHRGIVPVCSGCLDACSFCSTRLVKGRLISYESVDIIEEIHSLLETGVREIWITGQDTGCWGFERGQNLAQLIREILKLPDDFRLRVGMGNPRHLVSYIDELVEAYNDPRVYKFAHLPVQAGSDRVLEAMKRKHSVQDYLTLVHKFRKVWPDFTISTDIIVGFPGETESEFEETLNLLAKTRPEVCNRTRFVPREGTVAATMPDFLSKEIKMNRSARVTELFKSLALHNNQKWIGQECTVLAGEDGTKNTRLARNEFYKQVILPAETRPGKEYRVKIKSAETFSLFGEII
jgi:MiaB-like tRNA modifying enzyme